MLVSFPSPTKIFPFGEFPFLCGTQWSPGGVHCEKSHLGILGSKLACSYPRRFAACRALLQRSSLVIHQTALHVGLTRFTLQCLFSVGNAYLACVRLSLRADKSSLHPLLLTRGSGAACFCGDLFDQLDRQISTEQLGKYKDCCEAFYCLWKSKFLSIASGFILFVGW
jgi:hypothetical protein